MNYGKDFEEIVGDLLMIREDDSCPDCHSSLKLDRGIEVGNIFKLGTKYSNALKATFLDEKRKCQAFCNGFIWSWNIKDYVCHC